MTNNSGYEAAKLHRVFECLSLGNRKRFRGSFSGRFSFLVDQNRWTRNGMKS